MIEYTVVVHTGQHESGTKFWNIARLTIGNRHAIFRRWGKTNTFGQLKVETFNSPHEAGGQMVDLIASKKKRGYDIQVSPKTVRSVKTTGISLADVNNLLSDFCPGHKGAQIERWIQDAVRDANNGVEFQSAVPAASPPQRAPVPSPAREESVAGWGAWS